MKKYPYNIILASASPRRRELMTQAGYKFKVVPSDVDEKSISSDVLPSIRYAELLALAKAENIALRYPDDVVIGADTIVDFNGQIIGKPADAADARRITEMLFSDTHKVITGIAILRLAGGLKMVRHDTSVIYPRRLTPEQIEAHIRGGSWRDKAGAYAIQETGDELIEKFDGSLSNIMGMPMELLELMLHDIAGG
jgi:septum formation protein